ncbi:aspartyl/asparaginyl beta-hydroxylase domain-containing protein [Kibdelosporangium persicum]|uniref:Aspartyl beta-hydroxylase n=1 Tax=Kibdelosporangium persicum TaxID=2698649 RepID=A0ABX2FDF6_9PSEU|nr:aspartyl/asparaginyl beta-hydroxylase domain-containing protein [Kibdelosporangium persicum]NRN69399.1 Aspartyl beta-hydroxylase [Kibdelosporangium persicum]
MRTHMLGHLDMDELKISEELASGAQFHYAEQYPEFQSGRPWKTCMLWSCGGQVGDGVIAHYDTSKPAQPTEFGERLPYLRHIVEDSFDVDHLLFARLVLMSDNVLVPHRDFIEFSERSTEDRCGHRLHVPLATSPDCLFMEDNTIYRMPFGDVWSLDVTRMHSAAVLSDMRRFHLIMDFADVPDGTTLLKFDVNPRPGVPEDRKVDRPRLSARERDAIRGLAGVVDLENLTEVFGIVIRKQYRKDGGENYAWDAIREIARDSGDPAVRARVEELYRHCALARAE